MSEHSIHVAILDFSQPPFNACLPIISGIIYLLLWFQLAFLLFAVSLNMTSLIQPEINKNGELKNET